MQMPLDVWRKWLVLLAAALHLDFEEESQEVVKRKLSLLALVRRRSISSSSSMVGCDHVVELCCKTSEVEDLR